MNGVLTPEFLTINTQERNNLLGPPTSLNPKSNISTFKACLISNTSLEFCWTLQYKGKYPWLKVNEDFWKEWRFTKYFRILNWLNLQFSEVHWDSTNCTIKINLFKQKLLVFKIYISIQIEVLDLLLMGRYLSNWTQTWFGLDLALCFGW